MTEKVADVAVSPSDLQPGVVIQAQTPRTESQKRIEALLKKVVQQSVRVRKESKLKRPGSAHCDPDVPRPSEPTGLLKSVSILRNERRIVYSTTVPSMAQHRKDALKQRMIELKLKKLKAQRFIEIETEVKLLVRHLVTVVSDSLHFYGDRYSRPKTNDTWNLNNPSYICVNLAMIRIQNKLRSMNSWQLWKSSSISVIRDAAPLVDILITLKV